MGNKLDAAVERAKNMSMVTWLMILGLVIVSLLIWRYGNKAADWVDGKGSALFKKGKDALSTADDAAADTSADAPPGWN